METIGNNYLVRVNCMTYNQSAYITDTMNGFVMQQTSFPFVCTIVDDASTDGEQEVIRNFVEGNFDLQDSVAYEKDTDYGHVSFVRHKTNRECYFAIVYLNENHYRKKSKLPYLTEWMDTKYVANCEGDDYWTDPLKLQKQVDFLEEHEDYSLCCHRYKIYNQNDGSWDDDYVKQLFDESPGGFSFSNAENLNRAWITKTMTLVYRNGLVNQDVLARYQYRCDEHLNYHLLRIGLGYCFPFFGAVYRKCDAGVFSTLDAERRLQRWCRIRSEMLEYNLMDGVLRDHVYNRLRNYLYNRRVCKEERKLVLVCLKSFYKTEGVATTIKCAKKILGSYVNGLKKKND